MDAQQVALVTGANKGIGFAIAAGLLERGMAVGVGARDADRGAEAVERLGGDAFVVPIDVTDDASVAAAVRRLDERSGRLDVLVNNAGIAGKWPDAPSQVEPADLRAVLETNAIGVLRVTNAFLPLLRRSPHPRIVNQSSHVASLTLQSRTGGFGGASGAYSPSKTFVSALTIQYAQELADTAIIVNASAPGYVATDLNGFDGTSTPEQGAAAAIRLATLPDDGPRGTLQDVDGVVPW